MSSQSCCLFSLQSFGFDTAVAAAEKVIHGAHAEAVGHENGVGLVKLMGRESGFIALQSSIASGTDARNVMSAPSHQLFVRRGGEFDTFARSVILHGHSTQVDRGTVAYAKAYHDCCCGRSWPRIRGNQK